MMSLTTSTVNDAVHGECANAESVDEIKHRWYVVNILLCQRCVGDYMEVALEGVADTLNCLVKGVGAHDMVVELGFMRRQSNLHMVKTSRFKLFNVR